MKYWLHRLANLLFCLTMGRNAWRAAKCLTHEDLKAKIVAYPLTRTERKSFVRHWVENELSPSQ